MTKKIDYRKWISYVLYASPSIQKEIISIIRWCIEYFDHYSFNYYDDHVSIRVQSEKKKYHKYLKQLLDTTGFYWKTQLYDYNGRRSYELGTRMAFIYLGNKTYYDEDHDGKSIDLVEVVHGFLDNIGVDEKAEARLHKRMWWHFAVRKPYWRLKKRLKNKILFWRKYETHQ